MKPALEGLTYETVSDAAGRLYASATQDNRIPTGSLSGPGEISDVTAARLKELWERQPAASLVPTFEGQELDAKDLPEIQSEIRYIGDMQRLQVKPGDIFVLNVADEITDETAERLRKHLLRVLGDEAKVLVLDQRLTLGVMGPIKISEETATRLKDYWESSNTKAAGGFASLVELGQSK